MTNARASDNWFKAEEVNVTTGDIALKASAAYIGLATVTNSNQPALVAGAAYVGLATVDIGANKDVTLKSGATVFQGSTPWNSLGTTTLAGSLPAGVNNIGFATVTPASLPALVASEAYVGLATVTASNQPALVAGAAYVGLATVDVGQAERYSYKYTSGPTTDWIVKGSAGFIHAIHVGAAVASSVIEVSDHATDGDGNVQIYQAGDNIGPAVYPINVSFGTGITLDVTNQTHVTVIYK